MAMRFFFMDELQTIENESLTSSKIRNTTTNIDDHGKLQLLEAVNKLMKDDTKNEQKLIDSILEHNSNLIQAQNIFAQKTLSLKRQMIKVSLETTLFEMIKRTSQTWQI